MTNTKPKVDENAKLELREAAHVLDVSPSTIQKWTAAGKLKCGMKRLNGRKFWLGRDIIRAWMASI